MVLYNSIILLNEAVRANWEIENARHKKKRATGCDQFGHYYIDIGWLIF